MPKHQQTNRERAGGSLPTPQSVIVDVVDTYTRYDFEKALYERCKEVIKYFEDLDHRSHIDTRAEEMTAGNVDGLEALVCLLHSTIHNGEPEATQTTPPPFTPNMRSVIVDAIALMPLGTAIRAQWVAKAHEVLAQPTNDSSSNEEIGDLLNLRGTLGELGTLFTRLATVYGHDSNVIDCAGMHVTGIQIERWATGEARDVHDAVLIFDPDANINS